MKSFAFFVAGAAVATVVIGRSIRNELPEIVASKVSRGVTKSLHGIERKIFGDVSTSSTARTGRPYSYTKYSAK